MVIIAAGGKIGNPSYRLVSASHGTGSGKVRPPTKLTTMPGSENTTGVAQGMGKR